MGTAAYRRRELLYLLLIGTQKRMLSICINRLCRFRRLPNQIPVANAGKPNDEERGQPRVSIRASLARPSSSVSFAFGG